MNIAMIDTIEVSFDVTNYNKVFEEFLQCVEFSKKCLVEQRKEDISAKNYVVMCGSSYEIMPNGSRSHAYILHSSSYEIRFAKARSVNENFYPIFIKAKSCALWAKSPESVCADMIKIIQSINKNIEMKITERIKRVDLCCHTDAFEINKNTTSELQGKYRKNTIIRNGDVIETFGIASRGNAIYCRIYNKTAEVGNSTDKLWFLEIWEKNGFDVSNVWNVEFELKRDFLNEVGVHTFFDLFSNIKSLWHYCTCEWLLHKDMTNSRIERCPISNEWMQIQSAFDNFEGKSYISRKRQSKLNADMLIPAIVGYMTTYTSYFDDMDIDYGLDMIYQLGDKYLKDKGTDYESVINQKRKIRKGVAQ